MRLFTVNCKVKGIVSQFNLLQLNRDTQALNCKMRRFTGKYSVASQLN